MIYAREMQSKDAVKRHNGRHAVHRLFSDTADDHQLLTDDRYRRLRIDTNDDVSDLNLSIDHIKSPNASAPEEYVAYLARFVAAWPHPTFHKWYHLAPSWQVGEGKTLLLMHQHDAAKNGKIQQCKRKRECVVTEKLLSAKEDWK